MKIRRELREKGEVILCGKKEIEVSRIFSRIREKHKLFGRKREEAKGRTRKREIHPFAEEFAELR